MALNKDTLGLLRYNTMLAFGNKTEAELVATYGSIEAARLAAIKADSEAIINHIKAAALVTVTVTTTGSATAQSGGGNGTIA
jgi:hypothetical protein